VVPFSRAPAGPKRCAFYRSSFPPFSGYSINYRGIAHKSRAGPVVCRLHSGLSIAGIFGRAL